MASVLPQEVSKVAALAELRPEVQGPFLLPAVDVGDDVRVRSLAGHRESLRYMLVNVYLLAKPLPSGPHISIIPWAENKKQACAWCPRTASIS